MVPQVGRVGVSFEPLLLTIPLPEAPGMVQAFTQEWPAAPYGLPHSFLPRTQV